MVHLQWELASERKSIQRMTSQNFFLTIASLLSAATSISFLIIKRPNTSTEDMLCLNNAVAYSNGYSSVSWCSIQSALIVYLSLALTFAWTAQAIMLFVEGVLKLRNAAVSNIRNALLVIVLVIPMGCVAMLGRAGNLGYQGTGPWCFHSGMDKGYTEPASMTLYYYNPGAVAGVIGLFCVSWSLVLFFLRSFKKVRNRPRLQPQPSLPDAQSQNKQGSGNQAGSLSSKERQSTANPLEPGHVIGDGATTDTRTLAGSGQAGPQTAAGDAPSLLIIAVPSRALEQYLFSSIATFNIGFIILWIALLYYPLIFTYNRQKYINEEDQWSRCVFEQKYYVQLGLSQANDWKKTCGEAMYSIFNASDGEVLYCAFIFIMAGQSIVVWMMRLPQRVRKCFKLTMHEKRRLAWVARMQSAYFRPLRSQHSNQIVAAAGGGGGDDGSQHIRQPEASTRAQSIAPAGGWRFLSIGPLTALHAAYESHAISPQGQQRHTTAAPAWSAAQHPASEMPQGAYVSTNVATF
jgi:hypothetical protein